MGRVLPNTPVKFDFELLSVILQTDTSSKRKRKSKVYLPPIGNPADHICVGNYVPIALALAFLCSFLRLIYVCWCDKMSKS